MSPRGNLDPRTFIRVHDGLPTHPKVETLSDKAFRLLIESWCYCAANNTDGRIRQAVWKRRSTPKARQELVDAGLASLTDDGVEMHDYLRHQRSSEERAQQAETRANAGRLGGLARSRRQASAKQVLEQMPSSGSSKIQAETETETEEEKRTTSSSAAAAAAETTPAPRATTRGTRIEPHLDDGAYPVSDDLKTWVVTNCPLVARPGRETEQFVDYWTARTGKDATKRDWDATWRTWMRNAQSRLERGAAISPAATPRRPGAVQR